MDIASAFTESVAFLQPGTYLVICNLRGHFMDGIYAWIVVGARQRSEK